MLRIFYLLILFASLPTSIPSICFAQGTQAKQPGAASLQITIKSDKEIYEIGDEILLKVEIKNTGNTPVVIKKYNFPSDSDFEIIDPDEKPVFCGSCGKDATPCSERDFIVLQPQRSHVVNTDVVSRCCEMKVPGLHKITLSHNFDDTYFNNETFSEKSNDEAWTGNLTSNTITIKLIGKKEPLVATAESPEPH